MASISKEMDYGRRLLPVVIDNAAKERPDRVAYSFPLTNNPAEGFQDITNCRYANGVNRTAWWIEENFGKPAHGSFPKIGYIGPNDLRYALLTIAAVKVGYTMMYLSPRNSLDGHLAIVDKADCKLWILPAQKIGQVDQILKQRLMKVTSIPEQLELLQEDSVAVYEYSKTFEDARQDPFLVLHTSGSTGLPKPIINTNGSVASADAHHLLPPVEGRLTFLQLFENPCRAYSTFPMFHAAGIFLVTAIPFFYETNLVLGPPLVPVNLELVNSMFDHANVKGSFLAPFTLEEISRNPTSLERLAKTEFTSYGGGPLSQEGGDRINKVCRLFNVIGSTEGGLFPIVQAEKEDWNYIHFHPAGGFTYRQQTEELWEQFQTRDPKFDLFQAYMQTFPDEDEVAIKDLYAKHPTKPGLWIYRGRADDVIVLTNGEKVNPLDMEAHINNHPAVKASLVVGQGKFQTAVLIQLREPLPTTEEGIQKLKESLWTSMEQANLSAPAHGKLHKDYIMFATDSKPFMLAGKGTILRTMTVNLYEPEINVFYANKELKNSYEDHPFETTDLESIQEGVHNLLTKFLRGNLSATDDFFVAGLDSLSVFKVLANIRTTLQSAQVNEHSITTSLIYSNPTIEKLSKAVDRLVRPSDIQDSVGIVKLMNELLEKYTSDLPKRSPNRKDSTSLPSVILTGSTGSLGSYLLDNLLSNSKISQVFCLNRSVDAGERQVQLNTARGLKQNLSSKRVKFIHADLSKPNLGLNSETYEQLLQETTHIIHNQWQVDFNLDLSSFEPHIRGVRNLVDFALQSTIDPDIFFISSVGVVMNQNLSTLVPEKLVTDFEGAKGGYGSSKLVSEWILSKASTTSGVKASICRVGQVAGPVDMQSGMWNKQEWLPSIIASSKYLGMVPSTLSTMDRVDWIPVNYASEIIVELAGLCGNTEKAISSHTLDIFHEINPSVVSWSTLLPAVISYFGPSVSVVPWSTWLSALEATQQNENLEQNPGLKLLEFYKGVDATDTAKLELPLLETKLTGLKSETLRTMGPVTEDWMSQWMKQWGF